MFDPTVGRWLQSDPKGFDAGDPNLYRYVKNSPTNYTDPSGLYLVAPRTQIGMWQQIAEEASRESNQPVSFLFTQHDIGGAASQNSSLPANEQYVAVEISRGRTVAAHQGIV